MEGGVDFGGTAHQVFFKGLHPTHPPMLAPIPSPRDHTTPASTINFQSADPPTKIPGMSKTSACWPRLTALAVITVMAGCSFIVTKYNEANCRLPDTESNRAEVTNHLALLARQFKLAPSPAAPRADDNCLAQYHSHAASISAYVHRDRWQFAQDDIANFETLALVFKTPPPTDQVAQWLRAQLPPETLAALSNYMGGPDPGLQKALLRTINDTLGGAITRPREGVIYDPQRFAQVNLSEPTRQMLNRKDRLYCDTVELNERLLQDAYPLVFHKIFTTNQISVLLMKHSLSGKKSPRYVQIETHFTNDFSKTFGDAVEVHTGLRYMK